eukprot:SAG31_NODE_1147_length_9665_cov_10.571399_5_plen_233_part_00
MLRHAKGSYTLRAGVGIRGRGEFLLAARVEGGGLGSFMRIYTEEAIAGMTPGKNADTYLGKVEKGGLYLRRASKAGKKIPDLQFISRSAKEKADGSKRDVTVTMLRQTSLQKPTQITLSSTDSVMSNVDCCPSARAMQNAMAKRAAGVAAPRGATSGEGSVVSLELPVDGMLQSTKNLALVCDQPIDSSGGGPARCALRFGKLGSDEFRLVVGPPLSPLQAFAIALCSITLA